MLSELISVDPEVMGGTPVLAGTRVPVRTMCEYLEDNFMLDEFLVAFPTATRQSALDVPRWRRTMGP